MEGGTSRQLTTTPAREALLDAVSELLTEQSWGEVKMVEVAARAGVSRQTVYNSFGTREGLALAYVKRETAAFVDAVAHVIVSNADSPTTAVAAALELFLGLAQTHPLVRAIVASEDGDELLALVTTRGAPVIEPLQNRIAELIAEIWPQAKPGSAGLAADMLVRLAISHAALPGAPPSETARQVAAVLGPFIESEILAG